MQRRGPVVIVTGASRGIGAATAELLAAKGATVVCSARDRSALSRLADRIGGSVVAVDLREAGSADAVVGHALAEHGRLDVVVANAGVGYVGRFAEMPAEQITELVDLNVRAPMLLARAAIEAITATGRLDGSRRGAVVFVSSIAGAVGVPGEGVYSATKAAVDAFATVLREECRAEHISVSTVVPGVVATDFLRNRRIPYDRRFPRPIPADRVARAVVEAVETGAERLVRPRWLAVPARFEATSPRLYRRLARRFG